ncbi:hypothetical protein COZ45_02595 [Candidatus Uhrbacteria bacterium CG_4_10_14_3_um_filter_41_21]|nr:MAG: hypothetical protein COZ45_02595 [Candidatus Uhrbacteria bacterium CG_4_10_14_3_um_filter_41_21]
MTQNNSLHESNSTPPPKILPVLQKMKATYVYWFEHYSNIPKTHRYTLALKIDGILVEIIEMMGAASFASPKDKLPFLRTAIRKLDVVKILLMVLWETKSLENKKYVVISEKLNEVGKMLGGWHGQILKQNSPAKSAGEE